MNVSSHRVAFSALHKVTYHGLSETSNPADEREHTDSIQRNPGTPPIGAATLQYVLFDENGGEEVFR
jgi:hypothetical protein